jgi:pimeloyl-ACP methyl ester carboxylesterase
MNDIVKQVGYFDSHDRTRIYYESRGAGEAVVLIYGICCQMNHWHHQMSYFSKNYQLITFDLRGHHKSGSPTDRSQLGINAAALDMVELLKHLGIQSAHFVGHSFGTPVLIRLYDEHPELVKSLVFINGFSKNPIKGMFGLDIVEPFYHFVKRNYEANPVLVDELWKLSTDNIFSMWASAFAGGFNVKLTQFKDIEIYARGVSQVPLGAFLPMFEDLMRFDGENILRKITAPTLVLSGEKDAVTPLRFQEHMHKMIRGSEFVVVPYGSHCTQLDFPDYTNLKIEYHLKNS